MDTVERELFDARHCPAWFTADNRLGLLSISLDPPQCFNAEEYQTVRVCVCVCVYVVEVLVRCWSRACVSRCELRVLMGGWVGYTEKVTDEKGVCACVCMCLCVCVS